MPKIAKMYKPTGNDTPSAPRIPKSETKTEQIKQGTKIPNKGNVSVINKMNKSTHHTTS